LLFYQLLEHNVQGIFRLQEGGTNEKIFSFWQSEDEDKIIEYNPSNTVKHDLKKQEPKASFNTTRFPIFLFFFFKTSGRRDLRPVFGIGGVSHGD
jgi:hypothetical protein